jgi:hypothetical protein
MHRKCILLFSQLFFICFKHQSLLSPLDFTSRMQCREQVSATEAGVMVGYIRLLDVLSSQEFVFPSDDSAVSSAVAPSLPAGEIDVGGVVSMGLIVLTRVVTPDILQHFPEVQTIYFSVLSYALASSEHILPAAGRSGGSGRSSNEILRSFLGISDDDMLGLLRNILSLLLWGVTSSLNTATARMALQGVHNCATSHITSG